MVYFKKFLLLGFRLFILLVIMIWGCNVWVEQQTRDRIYTYINAVPTKKLALVLGTTKELRGGRINRYFKYRIDATVKLYQAGKIKHILVSGDNHTQFYNEPVDMKKALIANGIPAQAITLDYAGFRTFDSIVRAKEIFSQDDIIIVSQAFHNQRALFICDYYGIQAIGFNAQDMPMNLRIRFREYLARFKAVLDLYLLNTKPKFLGEKIDIDI